MRRRGWDHTSLAQAFDELRADYNAAKTGRYRKRLTGVSSMGSGADYHVRSEADYLRILELSRSFDRNDVVVGQGVDRLIANVLQDGMRLDPNTGDEKLDTELKARWLDWAEDSDQCHKAQEYPLHQLAELTLRHVIVDGDIIGLLSEDDTVELVEGHRLRTPRSTQRNVVHGVLLDEARRHQEYWLTKEDIPPHRQVPRVSDIKAYPARDAARNRQVVFPRNPRRVSQTRGISAFAPIVDMIGMHDDIQFARLVQAQIVSCFAVFRQREAQFRGGVLGQTGAQTTETLTDGSTRTIEGIAPGMEITGLPGETLQGFSPNIPNPEFFPHATLILTFISINLNLPVAVLLLDPSQTNFSGWRGAMDQARLGFRRIQGWMVGRFYRPIYQWRVRRWQEEDPVIRKLADRKRIKLFKHKWTPPSWPYIEPVKDAKADATIIETRLNSRRGVLARRGLDLDEINRETITDNVAFIECAIEAAEDLGTRYPDAAVDWHEVAGMQPQLQQVQDVGDTDNGEEDGSGS
jgi:lambda family phage portal protein